MEARVAWVVPLSLLVLIDPAPEWIKSDPRGTAHKGDAGRDCGPASLCPVPGAGRLLCLLSAAAFG